MNTRAMIHRSANAFLAIAISGLLLTGCKKDDSGPVVNNDLFTHVSQATTSGTFNYPTSAVPDAADQFIYFIATDPGGAMGVYKVASSGGAATQLFIGAPFGKPVDLAMSTDNQTLYIADQTAGSGGGIYSMSISGGTPMLVSGTAGTAPVALDVIQSSGKDHIYFAGTNAGDGQNAIFESVAGVSAAATIRYKGSPLSSPSGIVSAKDGSLYISDGTGIVHKLTTAGAISQVTNGITMGAPAGIALTPDESKLMVSSKNAGDGTAQVTVVTLQTGEIVLFNRIISANSNPGGLHAARNAAGATGEYGWADVARSGRVYRVEP